MSPEIEPIPLFAFNGVFEASLSLDSILSREIAGKITVVRDRKGRVRRAFRKGDDGRSALAKTIYVGTKYSFREHLPSGHTCHTLKRIGGDELRPLFITVLTDCIVEATA